MQLSYPIANELGNPGQRADNGDVDSRSYLHADVAQVSTVTVGGTATAGTYTITINGIDVDFVRVAETNAQIATALAAAIEAEPSLANVVTAVDSTLDVVITAVHEGTPFTVAVVAPAPGTLTPVLTTSSVVADLNVGIVVARVTGTSDRLRVLAPGDAVGDFIGIVERPIGHFENDGQGGVFGDTSVDAYDSGSVVSVGRRGRWLVEVEVAVDADDSVFVRTTATGTEVFGAFRNDADGGDAIDASTVFRFLSAAAAGGLAIVEARIS